MAEVGRLGPQVGSHLALLLVLCIHRVNWVNSLNDSTIKIVLGSSGSGGDSGSGVTLQTV